MGFNKVKHTEELYFSRSLNFFFNIEIKKDNIKLYGKYFFGFEDLLKPDY